MTLSHLRRIEWQSIKTINTQHCHQDTVNEMNCSLGPEPNSQPINHNKEQKRAEEERLDINREISILVWWNVLF